MTKVRANQAEIEEILNDPLAGASEIKKGTVEIATQSEVDVGTDTLRSITPTTLKIAIATQGGDLYEPLDSTILRDVDIGTTVQGYNPEILVAGDIDQPGIRGVAKTDHNHDSVYEPIITKNTGFNLNLGTSAGTVSEGNHTHAINDLSDVVLTGSPALNVDDVLVYNGTDWVHQPTSSVGTTDHTLLTNIGTNTHAQIDTHIAGSPIHFTQAEISITESQISDLQSYLLDITTESIGSLSDVVLTGSPALITNDILKYDGVNWVNVTKVNNWISGNGDTDFAAGATSGTYSFAAGKSAAAGGVSSIGLGEQASALGGRSVALGYKASAFADSAITIGQEAKSANNDAIAIGRSAYTPGDRGMTIGNQSSCAGSYALAIGFNVDADYSRQSNFGVDIDTSSAATDGPYTTKIGYGALNTNKNMLHLFDKGKLELYGDEAQFILPNYQSGSPGTPLPSTTNEGGMLWDSSVKKIKVYDGTAFTAIGGGVFTEDADANIVGGTGAGASLVPTSATKNFIAGQFAGYSQTTADRNILIGDEAGYAITTAGNNIAIGPRALGGKYTSNVPGSNNIAIGADAGRVIDNGSNNVFIGSASGSSTTPGIAIGNVVIGEGSGPGLIGRYTVAVGYQSAANIVTGVGNICIGSYSGPTTDQSNKLFIDNIETDTPLIGGDFSANTVSITANTTVTGTLNVTDQATGIPPVSPEDLTRKDYVDETAMLMSVVFGI